MKKASLNLLQRGVTLMELLVTLALISMLMVGVVNLLNNATEDAKASVTALHTKTVGDAAGAYIKDNYAAITSLATASTPVLLRVSDLVSTGYLVSGASLNNPRGQATCVLILQPSPNKLLGLVVTEGGDTIDDLTLGQIAAMIGGGGGGIYSTAPSILRGAMGGWQMSVGAFANANHLGRRCNGEAGAVQFTAGHPVMALWYADGASASSTLFRDAVPGNPSLNTMNTPILMGAGSVQTEGTTCSTAGAIGRSSTGAVLSCESGNWRRGGNAHWQDPVTNFASLPTCNAAALGHTRVVRTPTVGTGARAYTCNGSGTWQPLGIDNNGSITVDGTATITQANVSRLGGDLEITSVATEGAACSPNGRIARDANGLILSCQSGVWQSSSSPGLRLMPERLVLSTSANGVHYVSLPASLFGGFTPSFVLFRATAWGAGGTDLRFFDVTAGPVRDATRFVLGASSDDSDQAGTAAVSAANTFALPYQSVQAFTLFRSSGPGTHVWIWVIGFQ